MTIRPGETEVTARIGGFRQLGGGELPLPSLTILFTVRDGLITFMEWPAEVRGLVGLCD